MGDLKVFQRDKAPPELADFCRLEQRSLVEMLSLYCGDGLLAEELAQEALIRLCRDWHKVKRMENPRAWLQRVAINQANSYFRRKAAERRARGRLEGYARDLAVDSDTAAAMVVRQAVSSLPRRQKTVLVLHYFGDLSMGQVAGLMGCSENTAKSLARRGVAALRATGELVDTKEAPNAI